MKWFPSKKIIYGCDAHDTGESPYLTRWTLLDTKYGKLYLHIFHRSDSDELHDHPWNFTSFILWRGYLEETPCPRCFYRDMYRMQLIERLSNVAEEFSHERRKYGLRSIGSPEVGARAALNEILFKMPAAECALCNRTGKIQRRKLPGMILRRAAGHAHRVQLVNGKPSVTLVWAGKRRRDWGFFTLAGWKQWQRFYKERGCR